MALFGFGKKNNEKNKGAECACQCSCSVSGADEAEGNNCSCGATEGKISSVKVLGAGCQSCHALFENTKEALKNIGVTVDVEYVTDMQRIVGYGVMTVPALVVNEKVVSMGKVLKSADVEKLLRKLGV